MGSFMIDDMLKFGRIRLRGLRVMGFQFWGVHVTPNVQCPLAEKLCIGREHFLEVQEWYGPPLSRHATFGGLGHRMPPGGRGG